MNGARHLLARDPDDALVPPQKQSKPPADVNRRGAHADWREIYQ